MCYYRGDVLRIPTPSHAGPSEDELYAFLATPPRVAFDFRAVTCARDLHPLFARYHAGSPDSRIADG